MILLDSNVVSVLLGARREPAVEAWLADQEARSLFTSAIVAMEIRSGVAILPEGRRKAALHRDVDVVLSTIFRGAILPFDEDTAAIYADLAARLRRSGTPVGQNDAMIAATALQHDATVATRNVRHFQPCGVRVADPFEGP